MAAIVLGDITNLCCFLNKDEPCGVTDSFDSLFTLYLVCYFVRRKKERKKKIIFLLLKM